LLGVAIYMLGFALFSGSAALAILAVLVAVIFLGSRCCGCGGAPSSS
jgi:hypothetical protein